MSEEQREDNPKVVFGDLGLGQSVEVVLETPRAASTGEGKYGTWQLWFGNVENVTVHEGRGNDEKIVTGYSGKVIFFPAEKLAENLERLADGKEGVKVKITKMEKKSMSGKKFTNYEVEKLSEGKPSESSLTENESNLIADAQSLKNQGFDVTEDIFIKSSQEPRYGGKISEERAKELYAYLE